MVIEGKKKAYNVHSNPKDRNIAVSSIFCWLTSRQVHLWMQLEQSLRVLWWCRAASQASSYIKSALKYPDTERCCFIHYVHFNRKTIALIKSVISGETESFRPKQLMLSLKGSPRWKCQIFRDLSTLPWRQAPTPLLSIEAVETFGPEWYRSLNPLIFPVGPLENCSYYV